MSPGQSSSVWWSLMFVLCFVSPFSALNLELAVIFLENLFIPGVCVYVYVRARVCARVWRELRLGDNYE
jgi:hypothetical protein